jgi:hypothetical protein
VTGLAIMTIPSAPAQARVVVGIDVGVPGGWGYYPYYYGYPAYPAYYAYYPRAYPYYRYRPWYRGCYWSPYRCYWR